MCNFSQHAFWGKLTVNCPPVRGPVIQLSPSRGRHFCVISVSVHFPSCVSRGRFAELVSRAGCLELLPGRRGRRPHGVLHVSTPFLHRPRCAFHWALDSFGFCFRGIWDEISLLIFLSLKDN